VIVSVDVTDVLEKLRRLRVSVAILELGGWPGSYLRALPPAVSRCGELTASGWGCFRPAGHGAAHDPDGYPEEARDGC
jgi:hypothetical protein